MTGAQPYSSAELDALVERAGNPMLGHLRSDQLAAADAPLHRRMGDASVADLLDGRQDADSVVMQAMQAIEPNQAEQQNLLTRDADDSAVRRAAAAAAYAITEEVFERESYTVQQERLDEAQALTAKREAGTARMADIVRLAELQERNKCDPENGPLWWE